SRHLIRTRNPSSQPLGRVAQILLRSSRESDAISLELNTEEQRSFHKKFLNHAKLRGRKNIFQGSARSSIHRLCRGRTLPRFALRRRFHQFAIQHGLLPNKHLSKSLVSELF